MCGQHYVLDARHEKSRLRISETALKWDVLGNVEVQRPIPTRLEGCAAADECGASADGQRAAADFVVVHGVLRFPFRVGVPQRVLEPLICCGAG
jgi:hypothetical protein